MAWILLSEADFNVLEDHQFDWVTLKDQSAAPSPGATEVDFYVKDRAGRSLPFCVDDSGIEINIAHDQVMVVQNKTGGTLAVGTLVYISGSTGNWPTVQKAQANTGHDRADMVVIESIANNGFGLAAHTREVTQNTLGYTEGDEVYLSATSAGAWTATEPTVDATTRIQRVGIITKVAASGTIHFEIKPSALSQHIWHDATAGFVANEHIDHTSVSISAGTGLTGGGDISASRTLSLSFLGLETLEDPGADRIMFWDDDQSTLNWLQMSATLTLSGNTLAVTDPLSIGEVRVTGKLFVGDTANANNTIGLTINQQGNSDEAVSIKATAVGHGYTDLTEADTYATLRMADASAGGLIITGLRDADGGAYGALQLAGCLAENIDTTKSTSGRAIIEAYGCQISGSSIANVVADANIFAVLARIGAADVTVFIVDEDGDTWQNGTAKADGFMANGFNFPTGHGPSVEIGYWTADDYGWIAAYDRDTSTYDKLRIITSGVFTNTIAWVFGGTYVANSKNGYGITINQGSTDDEILSLKSSDVDHKFTTITETDTYFAMKKNYDIGGGVTFYIMAEDLAHNSPWTAVVLGGSPLTTKASASSGAINFVYSQHDNNNAYEDVAANSNIFCLRTRTSGAFVSIYIVDTEGDSWQPGYIIAGPDNSGALTARHSIYNNASGIILDVRNTTGDAWQYISTDADDDAFLWFAGDRNNDGGGTQWAGIGLDYAVPSLKIFVGGSVANHISIKAGPLVCINDSANTYMTAGLTINQGTNSDEILCLKQAYVAHGMVSVAETDSYLTLLPRTSGSGGVVIRAFAEDTTVYDVMYLQTWGGQANTAKTTAGLGLLTTFHIEHDGSGNYANITADGNLFAIRAYISAANRTVFIVDEDGDYYYDGVDGGAFDSYEDAHLARALTLVTSKDYIRSQFDEAVKYNESSLIEAGILGDTVANGGLINGAQLQRLHNGAIWQLYEKIRIQESQIAELTNKLKLLEDNQWRSI